MTQPSVLIEKLTLPNFLDSPIVRIHPTILHICWKAYKEALPILYGDNTFCFFNDRILSNFRSEGLPLVHPFGKQHLILPVFNAQPSLQGRLSMIRNLSLFLTARVKHGFCPMRLPLLEPMLLNREPAIREWSSLLERNPYADGSKFISFPALEDLTLDLSDWDLKWKELLDVSLC